MLILKSLFTILLAIISARKTCCYPLEFKPDYKEAVRLSLLYYEAQRSGKLPATNRINWRGDSALEDRGVNGEDLTGGYYDASDYVKFSFTIAFTATTLSWSVILYKKAYEEADQYQEVLEAIKWANDYFIKCHVSPDEFYGQVGDFSIDHDYWGRPEDMNMTRPSYKIDRNHPGSDLAAEAAATFASACLVFRDVNKTYSEILLKHAKELYDFGKNYRGLYQDAIPGAKQYYESSSYGDELTWAAIWLYKATKDEFYLDEAKQFYSHFNVSIESANTFSYNKKLIGIQVLLADATGSVAFHSAAKSFCDNAIDVEQKTPKGLIYIDKFGTLSHAANIAFVCLQTAKFPDVQSKKYINFAKEQIDYILGSTGRSFVVGYGHNYPQMVHHVASSCPDRPSHCGWKHFSSPLPNPQILYGALVSGPDRTDYYEDSREEFLYSDVTLDYNAGFQSALVALIHFQDLYKISVANEN